MRFTKQHTLLIAWLSVVSGAASAATVVLETQTLLISYETEAIQYLGTPTMQGDSIVFTPNLQISAPADEQYYFDYLPYLATLTVQAKSGFAVDGYTLTASGSSYVGDDARLGISGTFEKQFYGASYYSGALAGEGPWSASQSITGPVLPTISGEIYVETSNHYSYEAITGYQEEPYYEWVPTEVLVGYEPIYDENGVEIGSTPIYETQYTEQLIGINYIPIYETFYQTSGGAFGLERMAVAVHTSISGEVAAVPVPAAGGLFVSGIGLLGGVRLRRTRSSGLR